MTDSPSQRSGLLLAICGFIVLSCGDAVIKTHPQLAEGLPPLATLQSEESPSTSSG
jgi:hypothetical protein